MLCCRGAVISMKAFEPVSHCSIGDTKAEEDGYET